ncbi:SapC family protein [Marinobacter sp.]|uniref:SapC family protein n=1 Tax=Marinobacter sp. TaxID=50741 RepID=UPI0019A11A7E|nr:SapC family protein [Marinobacter sp.]MBD3655935.1 SapC family protein [Marinobacter sp.]
MTSLDPRLHVHLGWRLPKGFGFARRMATVPLAVDEITRVAQALPVVFRKGTTGNGWQAIAVMGPVEGANVCVSAEGHWRTPYVPAVLRVYPFCLDGANTLALWPGVQPEPLGADGVQPFFAADALTPRLQQTLGFLQAVRAGTAAADSVIGPLHEAGLLIPWTVPGLDAPRPDQELSGLYILDGSRSEALDDAAVLGLFRTGGLRWLHSHLDSVHHAGRFKVMAQGLVAPKTTSKHDRAADILAAIADDLAGGD